MKARVAWLQVKERDDDGDGKLIDLERRFQTIRFDEPDGWLADQYQKVVMIPMEEDDD